MAPVPRSLAALATIPGREAVLAGALTSLRPQVEVLRVVCHDMAEPPACVRQLADEWVCKPDGEGAAAKFRWAGSWSGLYLAVDDDFAYPPDYVETMRRWVRRWKGAALVVGCGRILSPTTARFQDAKRIFAPRQDCPGGWINYGCSGVLAFDTRLQVPSTFPVRNADEAGLAVWAQRRRVPFWLVAHKAGWLRYLIEDREAPTVWKAARADGFTARNGVLAGYLASGGVWNIWKPGGRTA